MTKTAKKKLIISLIIVSLVGVGGGVIFFLSQPTSKTSSQKNGSPPPTPLPSHNSPKKVLANQIKADLEKDLEKIKKGEKNESGNYVCSWLKSLGESCGDPRGNEWRLTCFGSLETKKKYEEKKIHKKGWIEVFPEELETNDWQEIESLIQQVKQRKEKLKNEEKEKETQKYQEEQAQIDQKLNSNPTMFLYEDLWEWAVDYDPRDCDKFRVFRGVENGQKFYLAIPENHPSVLIFSHNHNQKKFFQIEGTENIPLQPKERISKQLPWKKVNLADKLTLKQC